MGDWPGVNIQTGKICCAGSGRCEIGELHDTPTLHARVQHHHQEYGNRALIDGGCFLM